jgi:hypothetical protein
MGRVPLLLVSESESPPFGASNTLRIVENGLKMKRLWPPKVKGVNNSKKQTIEQYKGWFLNTRNFPSMLLCCH